MEFSTLVSGLEYTGQVPKGKALRVTQDSRKIEEGVVFVCIKGRVFDGHAHAQKALDEGAGMIVTDHCLGLEREIVVKDTRYALAVLCQNYFNNPAKKLKLIGVTGTNGKTTVTTALKWVLEKQGHICGLVGTSCNMIADVEIPAKFTTPDPWDLNALFAKMLAAGCTHVVMEASSQALEQQRLGGIQFALGVFVNLSRDHLDYHGDMENYFLAKKILFGQCDAMLVNVDDTYGQRLMDEDFGIPKFSFSAKQQSASYYATNEKLGAGGIAFVLHSPEGAYPVKFHMPGEYSVYNALAVAGAAMILGEDGADICAGLASCPGVRGRSEVIYSQDFTVICDFAHTGDAMEKLLGALKPYVKKKMYVLFGCTGQRDKSRRTGMAKAAVEYGDVIVVTSDNPRAEDVMEIVEDSMPVIRASGKEFQVNVSRYSAIEETLNRLESGDMLVLCSKGHEDYQVLDGVTLYLNERNVVECWLRAKKAIA